MVSTDSCLAGSMKLQVLTTNTSAWSGCGVSSCPRDTSWPIMTSLSTRFLGQPKLTKPIFKVDSGKTYYLEDNTAGGLPKPDRHLRDDLDPKPLQRHNLARMVREQPNRVQPQIGKNLRADAALVLQ